MKNIHQPTLLLNQDRALRNLDRMLVKAQKSGIRFRPHFKTHQSAMIGEWFRQRGVESMTVSSLDMAWYFAQHGWKDILVAFSVNLLEIDKINALAGSIRLHLLVESLEAVQFLETHIADGNEVLIWIKIDTGYQRTGLDWHQSDQIVAVAHRIAAAQNLRLAGILTHAGQTYQARSKGEIQAFHTESVANLRVVRNQLQAEGFEQVEISIGDTPSCSVVEDFSGVDEIRPGNFVFYDVMQWLTGACDEQDIAMAVACPVVAKHPERQEVVIYGGAVHLSKERLSVPGNDGRPTEMYGYIASPILKPGQELAASGWGPMFENACVARLSQEHGIVRATPALLRQIDIGDILLVLPVHACLTANLFRKYVTLDGEIIPRGTFT